MNNIRVYGADWCGDTRATRAYLDSLGLPYDYLNVDEDSQAATWVKRHNHGKQKLPTLDVAGTILSIPDELELDEALRSKGLLA